MDSDPSLDVYHTQLDDLSGLGMELVRLTATAAADLLASGFWR